jgi:hypothetical protein
LNVNVIMVMAGGTSLRSLLGTLLLGTIVGPATSSLAENVKLPAVRRFGSGKPVVIASVYDPASISTV